MGQLFGGGGLLVLACVMLLGFFKADLSLAAPTTLLTLLLTVILPAFGGGMLIYRHVQRRDWLSQRKDGLRQQTLEAEFLRLAAQRGGKLTVVEVVSELAVDPDTAQQTFASLMAQNLAEVELTDTGVLVYAFYDIQHLPDKSSSKGVLDA